MKTINTSTKAVHQKCEHLRVFPHDATPVAALLSNICHHTKTKPLVNTLSFLCPNSFEYLPPSLPSSAQPQYHSLSLSQHSEALPSKSWFRTLPNPVAIRHTHTLPCSLPKYENTSMCQSNLHRQRSLPSLRPSPKTMFPSRSLSRIRVRKQVPALLDRIEVLWDNYQRYYRGTIIGIDGRRYIIQYDDGTQFTQDLNDYTWRFVVLDYSGEEEISSSQDINFQPDDMDTSDGNFSGVSRGRRRTGEMDDRPEVGGHFLPKQFCKRLAAQCTRLLKR